MSRASERAYAAIRGLILSGELPAGAQLGEDALAERCGVSRTPVREALRRLEGDLLVTRTDTQRSFVADWSLDEVADSFELRAMLEGRAARRAAERMTDAVLARIRRANERVAEAISQPVADIAGFLDGNRTFHAELLAAAGSRRLAVLLGALVEQAVVWRTAHQYTADSLARSHREHEELIAAFARRDGAWAEAIMTSHILRAYHAYADAHAASVRGDGFAQAAE